MDWIIQAIKEDMVVKAFNKIFGSKKESDFSILSIIFFSWFYLIVYTFIFAFIIIKFFYYTIPKFLITKYKSFTPKKKALTRIIVLPFFFLPSVSLIIEYLSEKDYVSFFICITMLIGIILWFGNSIKKYRKAITLEEKEKVYLIVYQLKHTLHSIKVKTKLLMQISWKHIYAWGIILYRSTFLLYAQTTPLHQYQKSTMDILYYFNVF